MMLVEAPTPMLLESQLQGRGDQHSNTCAAAARQRPCSFSNMFPNSWGYVMWAATPVACPSSVQLLGHWADRSRRC